MRIARSLLLSLLFFSCAADIGEECEEVGTDEDCVDGAICTNDSEFGPICYAICEEHEDCPDGYDCNGVSETNIKSCQPD